MIRQTSASTHARSINRKSSDNLLIDELLWSKLAEHGLETGLDKVIIEAREGKCARRGIEDGDAERRWLVRGWAVLLYAARGTSAGVRRNKHRPRTDLNGDAVASLVACEIRRIGHGAVREDVLKLPVDDARGSRGLLALCWRGIAHLGTWRATNHYQP